MARTPVGVRCVDAGPRVRANAGTACLVSEEENALTVRTSDGCVRERAQEELEAPRCHEFSLKWRR